MPVIGADGTQLGVVDRMDGENRIRPTKADSPDGRHSTIPAAWIDHIDEHVYLALPASDAGALWQ